MRERLGPGVWIDTDTFPTKIAITQANPYSSENTVVLTLEVARALADVILHTYRKDTWFNSLRAHLKNLDSQNQD
jgi:hypothetical protein